MSFICFEKCVEYKHIAFVSRSTEKVLMLITNLGNVSVSFLLTKINFLIHDWLLALLDLYLLIKFGTVI